MFLNFKFFSKHAGLQANLNFQFFLLTHFWNLSSSECATCHTIIKMMLDKFYMLRQLFPTFLCVRGQQAHFTSSGLGGVGNFQKKKNLPILQIGSFFCCAWCTTILKLCETSLYTQKVFLSTILSLGKQFGSIWGQ